MEVNGYRLVSWVVMALSVVSNTSRVDSLLSWTCGVGLKNITPYLGVASAVAFYTAEPAKWVITETANQYWQNEVRNQSTFALSTRESCEEEDWVLVENKPELSYWEIKEGVNQEWAGMKLKPLNKIKIIKNYNEETRGAGKPHFFQ